MNFVIEKVAVTPKIRSLKNYFIHDKGITVVRIGGNKFKEMEAWLVKHGATLVADNEHIYSRLWNVAEDVKLLFALRWL